MRVVLPAPLAPSRPTTSPPRTVRSAPPTATNEPKRRVTARASARGAGRVSVAPVPACVAAARSRAGVCGRGSAVATASGGPAATAWPSSSTSTSAARSASSRYVVATSTAAPSAAAPAMSRQSSLRLTGSTPVVGSSRISSFGRCIMARAKASFWRMPPESRPASRPPVPSIPVCAKSRARTSLAFRALEAVRGAEESDVLVHGEVAVHSGGAGDVAEVAPGRPAHAPALRAHRAGHRAQQRRLAAAVAADDHGHRAGPDRDADSVQRGPAPVPHRDVVGTPAHACAASVSGVRPCLARRRQVLPEAEHRQREDDPAHHRQHDERQPQRVDRRPAHHHAAGDLDEPGQRQAVADPAHRPRHRVEREEEAAQQELRDHEEDGQLDRLALCLGGGGDKDAGPEGDEEEERRAQREGGDGAR